MTVDIQKIEDRIRALLNMADRPEGNEQEAFAAMELANKLCLKYNIEMAALQTKVEDETIVQNYFDDKYKEPWRNTLYYWVARSNFCKYYRERIISQTKTGRAREDYRHVFVGLEHNTLISVSMAQYLTDIVRQIAKENYPSILERTSFGHGFSNRVANRLFDLMQETKSSPEVVATNDGSTSYGLVATSLYKKSQEVNEDFLASIGVKLKKGKARAQSIERDSYTHGKKHGSEVALSSKLLKQGGQ